ncbi:PIN domain-containing protein [Taklimakanibacter deserti]|uniref:PIN domain-containing protein n=1 Tax=Taklimakanibacter deserti TaxID=2267839 RepID=UPI0034D3EA1A
MLDTDMASYVIKGRSLAIIEKLTALPPTDICISVITRAELLYGLKRLESGHRLQVGVHRFLQMIRVFSWGSDAADNYADIRHRLISSGQPIGELDMMIAAHSLAAGAVLVTNNSRHYERLKPPLAIVNWAK